MNLTIDSDTLTPVLRAAARIVPSRSMIPIMQHLHLATANDRLTVTASDLTTVIQIVVDADVRQSGTVCLPADRLVALAGVLTGPVTLTEQANRRIRITAGGSSVTLPGLDPDDYPPIDLDDTAPGLQVEAGTLRAALTRVLFAAGDPRDPRTFTTGVNITDTPHGLELAAGDGSRLSVDCVPVQAGIDGFPSRILVPAVALREVLRLLGDEAVSVSVNSQHTAITFRMGRTALRTQLLAAEWPNYQQLIRTEHTTTVTVSASVLRSALSVVSVLQPHHVRLVTKGDGLSVIVPEDQTGMGTAQVPASIEGEPSRIAVDPRFLSDVLAALDGEITIGVQSPSAPLVIRPVDANDPYVHVISPMFVQWPAEPVREAVGV